MGFLINFGLGRKSQDLFSDFGLLILRLGVGLMMAFAHGLGKIQMLIGGGEIKFPDPIGVGPELSLALAGGAEFFLALTLAIGLFTRLSAIPLAFTMLVAVFVIHADDPFAKQEFGLLYLIPFVMFVFTGAGRFSVDHLIAKTRS